MSIPRLAVVRKTALLAGVVGLTVTLAGLWSGEHTAAQAYLVSYVFWLSIPLGSLAFLSIHRLTGGAWGEAAGNALRAAMRTLPAMALLFLPIAFWLSLLYPWAQEGADLELRGGSASYLQPSGFWLRALAFFALWNFLGWALAKPGGASHNTDRPKGGAGIAAAGLLMLILTSSFAAFDWMMSLDPDWASSIYGAYFLAGQAVASLGFVVLLNRVFPQSPPDGVNWSTVVHDWGKLQLATVMVWAYFGFSQLLIIWMAAIPEEVSWYVVRISGGWGRVATLLAVVHLLLPFLLLLSRPFKQNLRTLAPIALLLLVAHWIDIYFQVVPSLSSIPRIGFWDLSAVVGIGGIFLGLCLQKLERSPTA